MESSIINACLLVRGVGQQLVSSPWSPRPALSLLVLDIVMLIKADLENGPKPWPAEANTAADQSDDLSV